MTSAGPSQIIAALNSLGVGEIAAIRARLEEARRACLDLEQADLAGRLGEALEALDRLDLKTYRKRVASVIAQLGHLR